MNRRFGVLSVTLLLLFSGLVPLSAQSATPDATSQDITFPALTGPYKVGRTSFEWVDQSRDETYASIPGLKRDLIVYVWFPAILGKHKRPTLYMDGGITWNVATQHLGLEGMVHTNAYISSTVDPDKPSYPVLIFAHGSGALPFYYASILEELASHGYIVIGTTHPYNTAAVAYPDGRMIVAGAGTAGQLTPDLLKVWTADIHFVLDQAEKLNTSDDTFKGHLDLAHVGVFGHSFGGSAAISAASNDPRVKAGASLEGGGLLPSDIPDLGAKPFLYFSSLPSTPQQVSDKYLASISGTGHLNFGDFGLLLPLVPNIEHLFGSALGTIDPVRGVSIVNGYLIAFFDHYLKGADLKWPTYAEAQVNPVVAS